MTLNILNWHKIENSWYFLTLQKINQFSWFWQVFSNSWQFLTFLTSGTPISARLNFVVLPLFITSKFQEYWTSKYFNLLKNCDFIDKAETFYMQNHRFDEFTSKSLVKMLEFKVKCLFRKILISFRWKYKKKTVELVFSFRENLLTVNIKERSIVTQDSFDSLCTP